MIYSIKHKPISNEKRITFDMVDTLYEGRGDCCRCGCRGNYYYPDKNKRKIMNTLEKMQSGYYQVTSIDDYIFEIELDCYESGRTKVQTLYLHK